MKTWIRHHWQSLFQTLGRMAAAPASTLANALVIGVVLALPLGAALLLPWLSGASPARVRPRISPSR